MYICPKCSKKLTKRENAFKCENGHAYDISSKGYVNLLLGNKKSGAHGDNKEMIAARRRFLSLDYYSVIADKLSESIAAFCKSNHITSPVLLDAGCGEGYYSGKLLKRLCSSGILSPILYAADVSKDAVGMAAKTYKSVNFSVASVNKLPFPDSAFDVVLSLFAPLSETEFNRVLKKGGILITVSPSENHLFGLKSAVYETPYKNPPPTFVPKILEKIGEETVSDRIRLNSCEAINDLFSMTPYYYNTGENDKAKLKGLSELETEIGFSFCIFRK